MKQVAVAQVGAGFITSHRNMAFKLVTVLEARIWICRIFFE